MRCSFGCFLTYVILWAVWLYNRIIGVKLLLYSCIGCKNGKPHCICMQFVLQDYDANVAYVTCSFGLYASSEFWFCGAVLVLNCIKPRCSFM